MSSPRFSPVRALCALSFAGLSLAALAPAQVPEGAAVVGTYDDGSNPLSVGTPGLFLVSLPAGNVTPITGLPPRLTSNAAPGSYEGTWSLARRSSDGALVVGTIGFGTVEVFVLHLIGSAVDPSRTLTIPLGTASPNVAAGAIVTVLPDDRILVAASQTGGSLLVSGAMATSNGAIIDTSVSPPSITLMPSVAPTPSMPVYGGHVVDPTGRWAYVLRSSSYYGTSGTAQLFARDLTSNSTCVIASWADETAVGITLDDDGTLCVSSTRRVGSTFTHVVHTVPVDGCTPNQGTAVQSSHGALAWGMHRDGGTGDLLVTSYGFASAGWPFGNAVARVDRLTGAMTQVAAAPPGGWAIPAPMGLVVNDVIESYGSPTNGNSRHTFRTFPNPGGLPTVGNSTFSLTADSAPGAPLLSLWVLSFGRGFLPFLGADVLIDVGQCAISAFAGAPTTTLPFGIPANPTLAGIELTSQTLHFGVGPDLEASRGLTFVVQ
jgi:hypothetical protein